MIGLKSIMGSTQSTQKFRGPRLALAGALAALVTFAALPVVFAQDGDAPAPTGERPWADGVSDADQKEALRLYDEGNKTVGERSYAGALKLYKQALTHWDHPAIRFNMAECFIHLDQPVLAYENIQKALKWGADPLEASSYDRALTNRKLLEGQIAYLVVESSESGAAVTLDGEPLMSAPGKVRKVIRPGRHQVVAKKEGRLTQTEDLKLLPGETTTVKVRLIEIGSIPLVRRWSAWKPWAVVGAGAVVALGGVGLQFRARSNMNKYDSYIEDMCSEGCTLGAIPNDLIDARDTAELQDVISISMMAVGGAAVAAGVVLVVLNQPIRDESGPRPGQVALTPTLVPGGAGASVSFEF